MQDVRKRAKSKDKNASERDDAKSNDNNVNNDKRP